MPFYGPWYGGWWIFPIIGLISMVVMPFFVFGPYGPFSSHRSGYGPWWGSDERGDMRSHPESPLDILKRRYASGEITKEEYEQMRRDLMV